MSAVIITPGYFLKRIGEDDEQPNDRRFCARLAENELRVAYREAKEAGDFDRMDAIDRQYNWLNCL